MIISRSKPMRATVLSLAVLAAPITLVGMTAPPAPTSPAKAKPVEDLPAAKQLFTKALEAAGGEAAFKDVKTLTFDVTIATPQGEQLITVQTLRPSSISFENPTPTGNTFRVTSNGKYVWVDSPQDTGMQVMPAAQMGPIQAVLNIQNVLPNVDERFKDAKTAEKTELGGKPAYRIETTDKSDGSKTSLFVNAETGEFLGQMLSFDTPMGPMDASLVVIDWEELEGRKFIKTLELSLPMQTVPFRYAKFRINEADEAVFTMPDTVKEQIKAMEEAEKAAQEGGGTDDKKTGNGGGNGGQ